MLSAAVILASDEGDGDRDRGGDLENSRGGDKPPSAASSSPGLAV